MRDRHKLGDGAVLRAAQELSAGMSESARKKAQKSARDWIAGKTGGLKIAMEGGTTLEIRGDGTKLGRTKIEDALDAAFGRAPPIVPGLRSSDSGEPLHPHPGSVADSIIRAGARSVPHPNAMRGAAPKTQARMTTAAHAEIRDGNKSGKHLFMLDRATDRWVRIRDDECMDVASGKEKFYVLTDRDVERMTGKPAPAAGALFTETELNTISVALHIRAAVMDNTNLTDAEKHRIMERVRAHKYPAAVDEAAELLRHRISKKRMEADAIEAELAATEAYVDLIETFGGKPLRMEKPTGSVFHKAREAFKRRAIHLPLMNADRGNVSDEVWNGFAGEHQIFLIEHNWAAAFAKAKDFDGGELQLPYPLTAYEFQINSRRVVMNIAAPIDDYKSTCLMAVQTPHGWIMPMVYEFTAAGFDIPAQVKNRAAVQAIQLVDAIKPLVALMHAQIRATLICLEAEVATTEVVRAPYKLNAKRERSGQLPLMDYHVVSLAHRRVLSPVPHELRSDEIRRSPRLHFRRGHYRHYPNYRMWIHWQLIGDPDLGFIDKHYRL